MTADTIADFIFCLRKKKESKKILLFSEELKLLKTKEVGSGVRMAGKNGSLYTISPPNPLKVVKQVSCAVVSMQENCFFKFFVFG